MPHDAYKALYIHIPFCKSRCAYCDFCSRALPSTSPEIQHYIERIVSEIRDQSAKGELAAVETIYIGGGTPTYIGSRGLTQILYALNISMDFSNIKEVTVEANPESLDKRIVEDIWALGVNRISIGVQSFDDGILKILGRAHTSDDARRAVDDAHARFDNVSIDLMCGIPSQTMEVLDHSLNMADSLGIAHVSVYPLSIEPNTLFYRMYQRGEIELPSEDFVADQMIHTSECLQNTGFVHYEISNYAHPGFESKHNCTYWEGLPYLGIGRSATTMTQNKDRRMRVQDGIVIDDLDPVQMAAENVMLAFRMRRGITDSYADSLSEVLPDLRRTLFDLAAAGLIEHVSSSWQPTEKGWLLGNVIFGRLMDLGEH